MCCKDRDGDASENHEQYASCSALSRSPLNEQQLVYWTRSFGVYRSAHEDAVAQVRHQQVEQVPCNQVHNLESKVELSFL